MLSLVKYLGDHVGRSVLAVRCSNGEIIPLICDTAEEELQYQKLCQTDIHDVRGHNSPLSRLSIQPQGPIFGIAEPPPGWPWFVVLGNPFLVAGLQRGFWSFDPADSREDAFNQLTHLMKLSGMETRRPL